MHRLLAALPVEGKALLRPGKAAFIKPMLALLEKEPERLDDKEWIMERKWDGVRCIAVKKGDTVKLYSRNHNDITRTYPEIAASLKTLPDNLVLDGELAASGPPAAAFSRLQKRIHDQNPTERLMTEVPVSFHVFDMVFLDGYDLTRLPLTLRKELLIHALPPSDTITYSPHERAKPRRALRAACEAKEEGLVLKRPGSAYVPRRSGDWRKLKCRLSQEFVVAGFTEPKGARTGIGALLVGYYEKGDLRYAGKVGTGYTESDLTSLRSLLEPLKDPEADLEEAPSDATLVRPELVAQVRFTEWTSDGRLRHPAFLGLRSDKSPEAVVRE